MKFITDNLYHVYNQGNNQEKIFLTPNDYIRFLQKLRFLVHPNCNLLAYCLMPNHFHFLLQATDISCEKVRLGPVMSNKLSNGFRLLLSEYAKEFNIRNNRSGSLFRQKTKAKNLSEVKEHNYPIMCFNYIHQNPVQSGLCHHIDAWEYSSAPDYFKERNGTICNKELAFSILKIPNEYFKDYHNIGFENEFLKNLY